ncbi:MAG TPA: group I intron-associated PD-(D/E)XK endonuclease [Candidatus Nitrosopolaris sp.]|nr:group I intron-associated PD-(D/E)XK endonuclease [Candidatus Nitrosopolaris sp.]
MRPKEKGDIALAYAIQHYLLSGYEVCLPVGDKRDYDLVIERDNVLERVQVKYAGFYPAKNKCLVGLRITGGNQSYHYAKKYTDTAFDYLFVYTARGRSYSLPWSEVKARSELSIENVKYNKYLTSSWDTQVVNEG